MYVYTHIHNKYIPIQKHTNLQVNATVGLTHPQGRDSQCQETFLAPPADKQTKNYDTRIYELYICAFDYLRQLMKERIWNQDVTYQTFKLRIVVLINHSLEKKNDCCIVFK